MLVILGVLGVKYYESLTESRNSGLFSCFIFSLHIIYDNQSLLKNIKLILKAILPHLPEDGDTRSTHSLH